MRHNGFIYWTKRGLIKGTHYLGRNVLNNCSNLSSLLAKQVLEWRCRKYSFS